MTVSNRGLLGLFMMMGLIPCFPVGWMWTVLSPEPCWELFVVVLASIGLYLGILLFEVMLLGLSIQIRETT